jgi:hypothetical protein
MYHLYEKVSDIVSGTIIRQTIIQSSMLFFSSCDFLFHSNQKYFGEEEESERRGREERQGQSRKEKRIEGKRKSWWKERK